MTDAYVRSERRGAVLVVTLDRPDQRNAYDGPGLKAVGSVWRQLDDDPDLRVGVLTGGDHFCCGADIAAAAGGGFDDPPYPEMAEGLASKPVIVAIEGMCLGGGMMIATGADLRIAGSTATFGLPEGRWNLPAQWLGALARRVAPGHVLELVMLGDERFPASRMAEVGFVNRVVPAGTALDVALEWAERVAAMAPAAMRAFKELTYAAAHLSPAEALDRGIQQSMELVAMADTVEGATAFAERRAPRFGDR
ncbi:MAG TPA: enoyl-CoA hydratase-related protein [Acidimicrobiales bacterium]